MKMGQINRKLKSQKGFTLIELMMVMIVLGILVQISTLFLLDLRQRAYDATALSDGKNLMTIAGNVFLALEDVDFTHTPLDGSDVGVLDTGGGPRPPVFTMSPGVRAIIAGQSGTTAGSGTITAFVYHTDGTDDPFSLGGSGKREFYFHLDELTSTITSPSL
jgi:prepilin-type N-terminal cleavage/methylation domain-containing protein